MQINTTINHLTEILLPEVDVGVGVSADPGASSPVGVDVVGVGVTTRTQVSALPLREYPDSHE